MPRVIPTPLLNVLLAETPRIYRAVEILFPTAPIRLWTGRNPRVINGVTYIGAGMILSFDDIEETGQIEASGTRVTLTGISSELISAALSVEYQGSEAHLYLGERSVSDVVEIGSGTVDQMLINDDPSTSSIVVTIENLLIDLDRPRVSRYTHEEQQLLYPGDMGFEYVADIQDAEINWS